MEEQNEHRIEESKKKAERVLEEMASGHAISKRWIKLDFPDRYFFYFSIDGGEEQKIRFFHRIMTDGGNFGDSHYIENCVKAKIRSTGLQS